MSGRLVAPSCRLVANAVPRVCCLLHSCKLCIMHNGSATVVSCTQAMCHLDVVLFPNRVWEYYFEAVSLAAELSFQQLKVFRT